MNEQATENLAQGALQLGIHLSEEAFSAFSLFAAELKKWSRKINLTAITTDEDIAVKHFLDSLSLLKVVGTRGSLADIGSGAGFPAIPLKIVLPNLRITSVDAVEKKIIFQRHAVRLLGLTDFEAVHARAEQLQGHLVRSFDWVVSRAFSDIPTFVSIALPMIREGGTIIAMKGSGGREEAAKAMPFLGERGLVPSHIHEFKLPVSGATRTLIEITRAER